MRFSLLMVSCFERNVKLPDSIAQLVTLIHHSLPKLWQYNHYAFIAQRSLADRARLLLKHSSADARMGSGATAL